MGVHLWRPPHVPCMVFGSNQANIEDVLFRGYMTLCRILGACRLVMEAEHGRNRSIRLAKSPTAPCITIPYRCRPALMQAQAWAYCSRLLLPRSDATPPHGGPTGSRRRAWRSTTAEAGCQASWPAAAAWMETSQTTSERHVSLCWERHSEPPRCLAYIPGLCELCHGEPLRATRGSTLLTCIRTCIQTSACTLWYLRRGGWMRGLCV